MRICEDGHVKIVYEGYSCPLCESNNEIDYLDNEVEEQIYDLNNDVESLEEELQEALNIIKELGYEYENESDSTT